MKLYHVYDTITEKKTALYSTPKSAKEDAQSQNFYNGSDVVETTIKGSADMFATLFNLLNDKSIHSVKGTETIIGNFSNPYKSAPPNTSPEKYSESFVREERFLKNLLSVFEIEGIIARTGDSQARFAATLGYKKTSINQWVRGVTAQPEHFDLLLRYLDSDPQAYDEFKNLKNFEIEEDLPDIYAGI